MNLSAATQDPSHYAFDHAGALRAPAGLLRLSGWIAGWPEEERLVRLRIDPAIYYDCRTGLRRPDVTAAHPEIPGTERSGFTLEAYVPAGFHVGTMEYCRPGLTGWIPFHTLSIIAELSPVFAQLECAIPADEADHDWYLHGWCFHPQSDVEHLSVQFAHNHAILQHGIERPDVSDNFPLLRAARHSGFTGHLRLGAGQGELLLIARLGNGSVLRHTLLPRLSITDRLVEQAIHETENFRAARIKFSKHLHPTVSIIIPVFNQLELTLACLESIVSHAGSTNFEVIVVDDKSAGNVSESLSLVAGLRILRNVQNQGFVLNCNLGASEARGDYLLFLNNDTEVGAGWLEEMLSVFSDRGDAGAVGAKLVYDTGKLQEAGGIIGEDGSGLNWGKGDDPDRPEYNYLRRVDFCSGACLLVKRGVFSAIGGFDTRYCPAYYEDVDLAFALRAKGLHTYYQPRAKIIHHEGMSSGRSTFSGVKRSQVVNQGKFAAKWESELTRFAISSHPPGLARDRFSPIRVLVLDACALTPDMDAGSVRMFNILLILARHGHKVTFAAENLQRHEPFSSSLQAHGVEHLSHPFNENLPQFLEDFGPTFDVTIISRKTVAARFLPMMRRLAPPCKLVFDTVDLMFLRLARQAEVENSDVLRLEAAESRTEELALANAADLTLAVSEAEAEILAAEIPSEKLAVVPLINDLVESPCLFNDRSGILFVGGFQHPPNLDGILFFLDEVLPLIRQRKPEIQVHIVGSRTPPQLVARAETRVNIHGFVPDLSPLFSSVRLSIAPLRFGAGIKGKISQSMASGVPVVGTTVAVEGMHLENDVNCLVADSPEDFANAVCRLHGDETLWNRLVDSGRRHVRKLYSPAAVESRLVAALSRLVDFSAQLPRDLPVRLLASLPFDHRVDCRPGTMAAKYLGGGWSEPTGTHCWSVSSKALVHFKIEEDSPNARLAVTALPFLSVPAIVRQRVQVLTSCSAEPREFILEWANPTVFHIDLENLARAQKCVSIEFRFPDARSPHSLGESEDVRPLGIALFSFHLERC